MSTTDPADCYPAMEPERVARIGDLVIELRALLGTDRDRPDDLTNRFGLLKRVVDHWDELPDDAFEWDTSRALLDGICELPEDDPLNAAIRRLVRTLDWMLGCSVHPKEWEETRDALKLIKQTTRHQQRLHVGYAGSVA